MVISISVECPEGSIRDPVRPRCYAVHNEVRTWQDANDDCTNNGGSLLIVADSATMFNIKNQLGQK